MTDRLVARAADYYAHKLVQFGATPKGADWNTHESQCLRFEQLLRGFEVDGPLEINDYGCGYGALARFLQERGRPLDYCGYDAAPTMIAAAVDHAGGAQGCRFTARREEMTPKALTVASGIFNVREDTTDAVWSEYVVATLHDIATLSTVGFSANFLTIYSDPERRRPDLFYADPSDLLRHALKRFSRRAVVFHDYPLYEFTLAVRL